MIVIKINEQPLKPYCIIENNEYKFFIRTGNKSSRIGYELLRDMYLSKEIHYNEIKNFINKRIEKFIANESCYINVDLDCFAIINIIPDSSLRDRIFLDLNKINKENNLFLDNLNNKESFLLYDSDGANKINAQGKLLYSYTKIFTNSSIEIVLNLDRRFSDLHEPMSAHIPNLHKKQKELAKAIYNYCNQLLKLNIKPTYSISLAIIN
ncbi:UNVERIFIED_CONTAM: hypothetical protein O8I53_08400 [Campylobacter lari]